MANLTETKILRAAGKKGKTKAELAEAAGIGYAYAADVVNRLLFSNKLEIVGKRGRADIFAKATVKPAFEFSK